MTKLVHAGVRNGLSLFGRLTSLKNLAWRFAFSGKTVLVIGCAAGNNECRRLIELGAKEVHGVDTAKDVGCEFSHPCVKYCRTSAESLGIASDQYDIVYCQATLEHIPQISLALAEAIRVAKRGGYIYCVASPLWHSIYGHHQEHIFRGFPWIHLRFNEREILEYCRDRKLRDSDGSMIDERSINYMLSEKYFNKLPARAYVETCQRLPDVSVLYNQLEMGNEKELTVELLAELARKGYTREELLATTHRFIGRKNH
jgi:ubiquinone/menaquinone biosynthesis C-methylase UbiE